MLQNIRVLDDQEYDPCIVLPYYFMSYRRIVSEEGTA
jgi:hypothetical protein